MKEHKWLVTLLAKYLLVVAVFFSCCVMCGFVGARVGQRKALDVYEGWFDEYKAEQEAVALKAIQEDPYTIQLNNEAEMLSKVLYGVKDNDSDDLRTYCWCVFNRVDNAAYPNTLSEVISQPNQWMRYSEVNPVVEYLYQIAREELDKWHTGTRRPVSNEYVFMKWSGDDICLRDSFNETSRTRYWRYNQ